MDIKILFEKLNDKILKEIENIKKETEKKNIHIIGLDNNNLMTIAILNHYLNIKDVRIINLNENTEINYDNIRILAEKFYFVNYMTEKDVIIFVSDNSKKMNLLDTILKKVNKNCKIIKLQINP